MSFLGSVGQGSVALFRHRGIAATAGAAVLVLIAGGTFAAVSSQRVSHDSLANASDSKQLTRTSNEPRNAVAPLRVVSVTPAGGTHGANGGAPVKVTFSSALAPNSPLPTLSPKISGSWQVAGDTATFTPSYGFLPGTNVTVRIPGGNGGVQGAAASAGTLKTSQSVSFTTGSFSTLRLQQVLAQLGYLPLDWAPDGSTASPTVPAGDLNAQVSAAYAPPSGTFSFQPGYPGQLTDQWRTGSDNMLDQGAIRAFEYDQGLTMDGVAGPQFWSYLLKAAAHDQRNPNGYTYALATQGSSDESLQVWHNGKRILDTPANTGIPAVPDRRRHVPCLRAAAVPDHEGHEPGRVEVRRPRELDRLLQRRRRGARLLPVQLRLVPEPRLRGAAADHGAVHLAVPDLRHASDRPGTGGLKPPNARRPDPGRR